MYGKTAETLGESCLVHALTFLFHPLAWYCMANTRARIREQKGIDVSNLSASMAYNNHSYSLLQGTWLNDCLITGFCGLCALPQMYNVSILTHTVTVAINSKTFEWEAFLVFAIYFKPQIFFTNIFNKLKDFPAL